MSLAITRPATPGSLSTSTASPDVGQRLKRWRAFRRLSQLELSLRTGISSRHLSFIETGRSRPSREMIVRLSDELDLAFRDRNALLLAAGYAPAYAERGLDEPQLQTVRSAIRRMLSSHEPYPAVVVDRHWNLIEANASSKVLTDGVSPAAFGHPANAYRASLHPEGMAPRTINLAEWRAHLLHRLRRQIDATGDPEISQLYEEVRAYPGAGDREEPDVEVPGPNDFIIPLRLRDPEGELSFFSTIATFGTPLDITVAELVIEAFYPADERTATILQRRTAAVHERRQADGR